MHVRDGMTQLVLMVGPHHTLRDTARLMAPRLHLKDIPLQFAIVQGDTRRAIVRRFPYAVFFIRRPGRHLRCRTRCPAFLAPPCTGCSIPWRGWVCRSRRAARARRAEWTLGRPGRRTTPRDPETPSVPATGPSH